MKRIVLSFLLLVPMLLSAQNDGHERLSKYIETVILEGKVEGVSIWTTEVPLDQSHVARNLIKSKHDDLPFPYEKTWLVMIDETPDANFGHPVKWLFVSEGLDKHSDIIERQFPPLVIDKKGVERSIDFKCIVTSQFKCYGFEPPKIKSKLIKDALINECKHAVLVSGGINSGANYSRYPQNLKSMYTMLRNAGFPKSNIFVYYADGSTPLDCDNADGDNNDNTGDDVTAGATESIIRAKFQDLCSSLSASNSVLFSYFSNHGADDTGVCLWDASNPGLDADELYSPQELSNDVANCQVLRHYMIHDQCYSGDFIAMATDGSHDNLVVYSAATASEVSWGREYMAQWEQNDITSTTLNDMHQDVVDNGNLRSTAMTAEGAAGIGDNRANSSCIRIAKPWWREYWYLCLLIVPLVYFLVKKR